MPVITFTYKIGKNTYYGKYASNDIHTDIHQEIQKLLTDGIQLYGRKKGLIHNVNVEITSFAYNDRVQHNMLLFDFYHSNGTTYINGRPV